MKKKYIHYGHSSFDSARFIDPVENEETLCEGRKPRHGLWGSNIESEYGWKEVIHSDREIERKEKWRLEKSFTFMLSDHSRILNIDNIDDAIKLFDQYGEDENLNNSSVSIINRKINWKNVAKDYDAIELKAGCNRDLRELFRGWECDSICVFHKNVIEII